MASYQAPIPPLGAPTPTAPQDRVRTSPTFQTPTPHGRPPRAPRLVRVPGRKSVFLAALLPMLLGPIGLAYSSVLGAIVTAVAVLVIGVPIALFFPPWMVVAFLLVVPVCVLWGVAAALTHNLRRRALLVAAHGPLWA